jgi:hypothetical protein
MNFAYIAINVHNFNSKADFRENDTSLNIKHSIAADVVIKKEHLGFLSDLAISKRHRRRVEI